MKYKVKINDIDYSKFMTIPFDIQTTLDESLDIAHIKLCYMNKKLPFKPLTKVELIVDDKFGNTKTYYFFVSSDEVTEVVSMNKYTHDISLIEQTKWLERFTGIVKCNTKPLISDYSKAQTYVPIFKVYPLDGSHHEIDRTSEVLNIKSPILSENIEFEISNQIDIPEMSGGFKTLKVFYKDELILNKDIEYQFEPTLVSLPSRQGEWKIELSTVGGAGTTEYFELLFAAIPNYVVPETIEYSITNVIDNLLETAECLTYKQIPRFRLNLEQSVEFEEIKAPDFCLIGTLWECLSEVGRYIHAIPRLENNVIYFDKLGQPAEFDFENNKPIYAEDKLKNYCSNISSFNIEDYATSINSNVDNIVNTDIGKKDTIISPNLNIYKTVRTETGTSVLTNENILIETEEPIEEIIKVECGYISNNRLVGDITPYIFEIAEYNALSSFDMGYPLSRNFALVYTQGQKDIKGLAYKSPNAISPVFAETSIINIIARKLGVSAASIKSEDIMNLQFKVTYVPIISARLKQSKVYIEDLDNTSTLDYNQSANKINSIAYGENMKGVIARLGNPEINKMYIVNKLFTTKVGELFNKDYYVSVVKTEYYKDFIKLEVALSKDFNRLNDYVGVNSQKRFYEISEKQAIKRPVVYEDYCVLGNTYVQTETRPYSLLTTDGFRTMLQGFGFKDDTGKTNILKTVDTVDVQGFNYVNNEQVKYENVNLPVRTLAIGNSLSIGFRYDDNFSAGNTRKKVNGTNVQYQTKYTDLYGNIKYLTFDIGSSIGEYAPNNYNDAVSVGNSLPKYDIGSNIVVSTLNETAIKLYKDSREYIDFSYQLNFVSDDSSYVLGKALTQYNMLVTSGVKQYKLYVYQNEISKFQGKMNINNEDIPYDDTANIGKFGKWFKLNGGISTKSGKSWAYVSNDGELLFGRNIDIKENDKVGEIKFTFTHII